jgi:hypothetical protein
MGFDIRLPIGALFTVMGLLLTIFGFISDTSIYERSLHFNVNLGWGMVLLVFGILMYVFGRRADAAASRKK